MVPLDFFALSRQSHVLTLCLKLLPDKLKPSSLKERQEKAEDINDGIPTDVQDIPCEPAKLEDHVCGNPYGVLGI
jgi:hypothetical protein